MDSDEWGEGGRVGTDERGGCAAGPSSSVCVLVVCVHACRLGRGEGWGMMEGEAAGPSSSVGARRPWVVGCCWPCVLAGHSWGLVLYCPWASVMCGWHIVIVYGRGTVVCGGF